MPHAQWLLPGPSPLISGAVKVDMRVIRRTTICHLDSAALHEACPSTLLVAAAPPRYIIGYRKPTLCSPAPKDDIWISSLIEEARKNSPCVGYLASTPDFAGDMPGAWRYNLLQSAMSVTPILRIPVQRLTTYQGRKSCWFRAHAEFPETLEG